MNMRPNLTPAWKRWLVMSTAAAIALAMAPSRTSAQEAESAEQTVDKVERTLRETSEKAAREINAAEKRIQELEAQQRQLNEHRKAFEAQLKERQKQFQEQLKMFEAQQQELQRAKAQLEAAQPDGGSRALQLLQSQGQQQQQEAIREAMKQMKKLKSAPMPQNAQTKVFSLKYSELPPISRVLTEIVGDRGLRIGIDDRTNSLIVSANEETMDIVDALLARLDVPAGASESDVQDETLQLRVIWLLDGGDGQDPASGAVSPQVIDALKKLGFEAPTVMCQQVNTLTLDEKNRGQYGFSIPVLVNSESWQLSGNGTVRPAGPGSKNRFGLEFDLIIDQPNNPQKSRLNGSIYSPLGHYTVMGTTTFVENAAGQNPAEDATRRKPKQRLSAFVVYLDRAPKFPDAAPDAAEKNEERSQ